MRVLLAVSGGIDSMYMLHRAPELFPGASCAVAHCNFCLRGEESDADEAFVLEACRKLGVECFTRRFDTLAYAGEKGVSVEMAARELRYTWFGEVCAGQGFDAVATAHNANDNAETLILNLLRGTGTKGLRGIPSASRPNNGLQSTGTSGGAEAGRGLPNRLRPRNREWEGPAPKGVGGMDSAKRPVDVLQNPVRQTSSCVAESEVPVLCRPLLDIPREDIKKWMTDNGFEWREDHTNAENEVKRNKIRNLVFPVFARINPSFIRTLGEDMERIRQADDIADDYFREAADNIVRSQPSGGALMEISVTGLVALKHWRYVLWRLLENYSFSAETFDRLCSLLDKYRSQPSGTVTLSGKTFQSPRFELSAHKKYLILRHRSE